MNTTYDCLKQQLKVINSSHDDIKDLFKEAINHFNTTFLNMDNEKEHIRITNGNIENSTYQDSYHHTCSMYKVKLEIFLKIETINIKFDKPIILIWRKNKDLKL